MKPLIVQNKKKLGFKPNVNITPRNEKSIAQYFADIKTLDAGLLTKEQEIVIFEKIHQGDVAAKTKLIHSNLKFVISVAKNYLGQGLPFEDLINEGNIGLIKAVDRYDETRGLKFISFAVWWIRQSMLEALVLKGKTVRIPIQKKEYLLKVNKIIAKLEQELERKPTIEEIVLHAQDLKNTKNEITSDDIVTILLSNVTTTSLDEPIFTKGGEEEGSLYDILPSSAIQQKTNVESIDQEIDSLLSELSEKERNIIELSYGIKHTHSFKLEEIADMFFVSKEMIRQIKEKAILKLRNNPKIKLLLEYTLD